MVSGFDILGSLQLPLQKLMLRHGTFQSKSILCSCC